jgi:hypothetical protein
MQNIFNVIYTKALTLNRYWIENESLSVCMYTTGGALPFLRTGNGTEFSFLTRENSIEMS